ncbi:MAG: hypothetical protein HRT87_05830 [Legionellales bacterium]|nr:hypothetical protein [Legionellales bacterium]
MIKFINRFFVITVFFILNSVYADLLEKESHDISLQKQLVSLINGIIENTNILNKSTEQQLIKNLIASQKAIDIVLAKDLKIPHELIDQFFNHLREANSKLKLDIDSSKIEQLEIEARKRENKHNITNSNWDIDKDFIMQNNDFKLVTFAEINDDWSDW